ncbi:CAAX protease self-immunity [Pseudooceanicola antarcticus]|uniref:CAAX protease self-immunity n=1 Tax=Pseudooceanicola antarcticus TaxID=1247613 RepID=A0A285IJ41_9RHOB|nr:CPBP family intramembrane glutamic endopeptidase [Pseudooceanicola antarcticus]PJE28854.1 CPBP family intramembrane metalloprotease [Pseudooceanicola antarcticus]SNY47988.1 CAAX protease self-immunity [Pseudooceanicola antarcticus]
MVSETNLPAVIYPADLGDEDIPHWSPAQLFSLWLLVALPMAGLSLGLAPFLVARLPDLNPGLIYWGTIIAGMAWQTAVALGVLYWEGQARTGEALRRSLWLIAPRIPGTSKPSWGVLLGIVPLGIALVFILGAAFGSLDSLLAARLPEWMAPTYGDITSLATAENTGNWNLLWIALLSSLFNYVLGEAFFFHGILLPRMVRTFGGRGWIVNAVAFAAYHSHKAPYLPTILLSCLVYALSAHVTRSSWPAVLIHGFEGLILIGVVIFVVLGGMPADPS